MEGVVSVGQIFDFSGIEKSEKTIRKTWSEFRDALAKGIFTYDEVEKEKRCTFLKVYDDLFHTDDKTLMYTPFQTMAQYYISLGYSGIIYGSTVSAVGRNIVLFDKNIAYPSGAIEDYVL